MLDLTQIVPFKRTIDIDNVTRQDKLSMLLQIATEGICVTQQYANWHRSHQSLFQSFKDYVSSDSKQVAFNRVRNKMIIVGIAISIGIIGGVIVGGLTGSLAVKILAFGLITQVAFNAFTGLETYLRISVRYQRAMKTSGNKLIDDNSNVYRELSSFLNTEERRFTQIKLIGDENLRYVTRMKRVCRAITEKLPTWSELKKVYEFKPMAELVQACADFNFQYKDIPEEEQVPLTHAQYWTAIQ